MSLKGKLAEFSMPELFRMLGLTGKTGCLEVAKHDFEGKVYFRDGKIFFATTSENRVLLGVRLVEEGLVKPEQLSEALETQKSGKTGDRLGQILVANGHISQEVLQRFIKDQIEDSLYQIFEWSDGSFSFAADETAPEEDIGVYLPAEEIITEAQRWREEWTKIKEILPSLDVSLTLVMPVAEQQSISLDYEEWRLVCLMEGKCALPALQKKAGLTSLGLCRMLARMINKGVLTATALESAVPDVISDEHAEEVPQKDTVEEAEHESEEEEAMPAEWASYYERLYRQAAVAKTLVKKISPKK